MRTFVEDLPCDIRLPAELTPIPSATPQSLRNALVAVERELNGTGPNDRLVAVAAGLAKSIVSRTRIEAVLLPKLLRDRGADSRAAVVTGTLAWELEARGMLLLVPFVSVDGSKPPAIGTTPRNLMTYQAMHEADVVERAKLWKARWGVGPVFERDRKLVARYIAGDYPVAMRISQEDPAWKAELDTARGVSAPVMWPRAVAEQLRVPLE